MPFRCPNCTTAGSLKIRSRIELPPDSRSDEITLQIVSCARCGFAGVAVYEESRRGALDDDSFDHTGYHVSKDDLRALRKTIAQCPKPRDRRCDCTAHRALGRKNEWGRWNALDDIALDKPFALELS
jgi:hypothetical protein